VSSEIFVRRMESIHLGDDKYLDARAVEMEWLEHDEDLGDDEMATLAVLRFSVSSEEYVLLARLGMVDTVPAGGDEEEDRSAWITFRTDRDLLDEAEEALREEWEQSLEDDTCDLTIWSDLDYWEVQTID
jgi:hypothetical protein